MKENGKAAIQRDLARLEEWATRSLVKFSEDKCKVLDLGRKKPWQKHKPGLPGRDVFCKGAAWPSSNPRARELELREVQCWPCPLPCGNHGAGYRVTDKL